MGNVAAPVIGTVLNQAKERGGDEYTYGEYAARPEPLDLVSDTKPKTGRERRRKRRDKVSATS
jgi:hypothetical protein